MENDKNRNYGHEGRYPHDHNSQNFESFLNKNADYEASYTAEELRSTNPRRFPDEDRGMDLVNTDSDSQEAQNHFEEESDSETIYDGL